MFPDKQLLDKSFLPITVQTSVNKEKKFKDTSKRINDAKQKKQKLKYCLKMFFTALFVASH